MNPARKRPRPVRVLHARVGHRAIEAFVQVRADASRTSAAVAGTLLAVLPGLLRHECDNTAGLTFPEELRDTETAHAFEHVAIEVMRRAGDGAAAGETRWDFRRDGRGRYRLRLRYEDDLIALGALRLAEELLAHAVDDGPAPDVRAAVARLRAAAGRDGGSGEHRL